MTHRQPKIAVIDPNTLALIGLKQLLQTAMPFMEIDCFNSFGDFAQNEPETYVHYFVAMNVVLENRAFFVERRKKTIVLTQIAQQIPEFHCLPVNVSEETFVRLLLQLEQGAHQQGRNLPTNEETEKKKTLSAREIEVLSLIVQGKLNKEIADRLGIGLTTVITHRKNIVEKLGIRSVSALTIYAVMHGLVNINDI